MLDSASGVTSTLLTRAADVVLQERRRLVLMVRETPLHRNHLRTMTELAELGAIIAPPVPAFYALPKTLDEMVDHSLGRVLDLFDIELGIVRRWRDDKERAEGRARGEYNCAEEGSQYYELAAREGPEPRASREDGVSNRASRWPPARGAGGPPS